METTEDTENRSTIGTFNGGAVWNVFKAGQCFDFLNIFIEKGLFNLMKKGVLQIWWFTSLLYIHCVRFFLFKGDETDTSVVVCNHIFMVVLLRFDSSPQSVGRADLMVTKKHLQKEKKR